jgi:hypothetical protein
VLTEEFSSMELKGFILHAPKRKMAVKPKMEITTRKRICFFVIGFSMLGFYYKLPPKFYAKNMPYGIIANRCSKSDA